MKIDIQAGDIILFSRPCLGMDILSSATCFAAKASSVSIYDHLGVVVEDINTSKLLLLEANSGGVTLHPLDERLKRTKASEIAIRKLICSRNPTFKRELWDLASKRNGLPYNRSMYQMSSAMVRSYLNTDDTVASSEFVKLANAKSMINNEINSRHFMHHSLANVLLKLRHSQIERSLVQFQHSSSSQFEVQHQKRDSSPEDAYYCSQLVAEVLLQLGVIASPSRRAEDYIPADFSSRVNSKNLHTHGGCHFSPDLVVTTPRRMKLHTADSVYTIDVSRVRHVHAETVGEDQTATIKSPPSSQTKHEWKLTTHDIFPPQILSQMPHVRTSSALTEAENHLEVVHGSVDVMMRDSGDIHDTQNLRTVGVLPPGKYYLHNSTGTSSDGAQQNNSNTTLSVLTQRHGADRIYLRARERSTLRLTPATATTTTTSIVTPSQSHAVHYSLAPQILHEIATGLSSTEGSVVSAHHGRDQFVALGDLLAGLTMDGVPASRTQLITDLHVLLTDLLPSSYLQSSDASVNLSLLCEVDSCIVEGQSAAQIVELLGHFKGGEKAGDHQCVVKIEQLLAAYRQEGLETPTADDKKCGLVVMAMLGLVTLRKGSGSSGCSAGSKTATHNPTNCANSWMGAATNTIVSRRFWNFEAKAKKMSFVGSNGTTVSRMSRVGSFLMRFMR